MSKPTYFGESWSPPASARSWWEALTTDSAAGVLVANAKTAQIHFINDRFARWFGLEPQQVIGGRLGDHLPREAGEERLGIVRLAYDSQRPVVVNDMWKGVALRVVARSLYAPGKGPEEVLVTLRTRSSLNGDHLADPENAYIVTPRHVDRGALASLSPREMDVFALLAQGLSCSQIAQRLERSIKTIHRHRESIGKKLSLRNRLDLIRLAHLAGIGGDPATNGVETAHTPDATPRNGTARH